MVEHSKDELLHGRETFRHDHVVIVFVLSVAFRRRRHLVLGGVLIAVADWDGDCGCWSFLNLLDMGWRQLLGLV